MTSDMMASLCHEHGCILQLIVINVLLTNRIHLVSALPSTTEAPGTAHIRPFESGRLPSIGKTLPLSNSMSATTPPLTPPPTPPPTPTRAVVIDLRDDTRPIVPLDPDGSTQKSSMVFFSASLSIFAAIGVVIFCRKCVRCPAFRHTRHGHFVPPDEGPVGVIRRDFSSPKMNETPSIMSSPNHRCAYLDDDVLSASPLSAHDQDSPAPD